jgi:hypothetical protein
MTERLAVRPGEKPVNRQAVRWRSRRHTRIYSGGNLTTSFPRRPRRVGAPASLPRGDPASKAPGAAVPRSSVHVRDRRALVRVSAFDVERRRTRMKDSARSETNARRVSCSCGVKLGGSAIQGSAFWPMVSGRHSSQCRRQIDMIDLPPTRMTTKSAAPPQGTSPGSLARHVRVISKM